MSATLLIRGHLHRHGSASSVARRQCKRTMARSSAGHWRSYSTGLRLGFYCDMRRHNDAFSQKYTANRSNELIHFEDTAVIRRTLKSCNSNTLVKMTLYSSKTIRRHNDTLSQKYTANRSRLME